MPLEAHLGCRVTHDDKARLRQLEDENKRLKARVETLEDLCNTAIEERDKYEGKWRQTLAVMEDAREMMGSEE